MVNWQEGDVLTNGIRLHYYRSGGDKPPLVFAASPTAACWLPLSEIPPDYDLTAIDARGHGKLRSLLGAETHAADPAGLIEALLCVGCPGIGWGWFATVLAALPAGGWLSATRGPPIRDRECRWRTPPLRRVVETDLRARKSVDELIAEALRIKWPVVVLSLGGSKAS